MAKTTRLHKQQYRPNTPIAGVKIVDLKTFVDDGGYFLELGRFQKHVFQHFPQFELKQLNLSEMDPGVIKAWHIHKQQDDIWFVPPSHRMLAVLKDIRPQSKTYGAVMRFVLGGGVSKLLFIPRGVAHGAANLWDKPSIMLYLVNQHFSADSKTNDEYRLDWDEFGEDLWKQTKG